MPQSRLKYCLLILVALFTTSCEMELDNVPLPDFVQKLVITSFISPSDSVSFITVQSNQKIFGELNNEKELGNLSGFISDGTTEVALGNSGSGLVINHNMMPILSGHNYKISISTDRGFSVDAQCTVPEDYEFSIKADTFSVPGQDDWYPQSRLTNMRISIKDIPGQNDYYRITGKVTSYNYDPYSDATHASNGSLYFENELLSDESSDADGIIQTTSSNIDYYIKSDSSRFVIYLLHTDKPYYLYHKSLNDYESGENPFTEATLVYSNINGGLGIFASYTLDSLVLKFK